jgi:hypothetical protein
MRTGDEAMKRFTPSALSSQVGEHSSLIDRVRTVCDRLADAGWAELFEQHGLDIRAADLGGELARTLDHIDRRAPGFEDFAVEGRRGVEPGKPAQSLLFHAFASPQVTSWRSSSGERTLTNFPTPGEIELVENYVYGVVPPSIGDLRARAGDAPLAIIVVAAEYRPAIGTVHRKHADMCYARTGVARVGTRDPEYLPEARGYLPFVTEDDRAIRVLPCRYAAYIAARSPGQKRGHGPMRFIDVDEQSDAELDMPPPALRLEASDDRRRFWIPLHKLFDGSECLRGRTLEVRLSSNHRNEKIRRAHMRFLAAGHDAGYSEPELSQEPFVIQSGIAEFSNNADDGSWLLVPKVRPRLVAPAEFEDGPLTFLVPKDDFPNATWGVYQSSLNLLAQPSGARSAPEYLHARHSIENGSERDLNAEPDVIGNVTRGGYRARHYVDYTGDGWIEAECSALALDIPRRLPAYSIVAAPDFFPLVDQSTLMQWTEQSVPPQLLENLWSAPGKSSPEPLSDQRFAANLELSGAGFDRDDDTMTAIVGSYGSGSGQLTRIDGMKTRRASTLPDGAAGVFAPGWDVAFDRAPESFREDSGDGPSPGVTFLTNYGLGSPFPEDSLLCAALSSFWPAAAPDITRTFAPSRRYATVTPLPDEVIGLGESPPWDGIKGPVIDADKKVVEYTALAYGDYVRTMLENGFFLTNIGQTTLEEYLARTATMALVYRALGVATHDDKLTWSVLSFKPVDRADPDLKVALEETGRRIDYSSAYRYEVFRHGVGQSRDNPAHFAKRLVDVQEVVLLFADPSIVLFKRGTSAEWSVYELRP